MKVLVDQDGVLADFEGGFLTQWQLLHPDKLVIAVPARRTFYQHDDYPKEYSEYLWQIYQSENFFLGLPPIEGAVPGMHALLALGHDVRICTTPIPQYQYCVSEKLAWVERHLGRDFVSRVILTSDKTWIKGDVLLDDRPEIHGSCIPEWEHVIYDAPYNREVKGKRRLTWANLQEVLFS